MLAVLTLLRQRRLQATAIVLGECSSAAVLLTFWSLVLYLRRHGALIAP